MIYVTSLIMGDKERRPKEGPLLGRWKSGANVRSNCWGTLPKHVRRKKTQNI